MGRSIGVRDASAASTDSFGAAGTGMAPIGAMPAGLLAAAALCGAPRFNVPSDASALRALDAGLSMSESMLTAADVGLGAAGAATAPAAACGQTVWWCKRASSETGFKLKALLSFFTIKV